MLSVPCTHLPFSKTFQPLFLPRYIRTTVQNFSKMITTMNCLQKSRKSNGHNYLSKHQYTPTCFALGSFYPERRCPPSLFRSICHLPQLSTSFVLSNLSPPFFLRIVQFACAAGISSSLFWSLLDDVTQLTKMPSNRDTNDSKHTNTSVLLTTTMTTTVKQTKNDNDSKHWSKINCCGVSTSLALTASFPNPSHWKLRVNWEVAHYFVTRHIISGMHTHS